MLNKKIQEVECFELDGLENHQAVFLKTEDSCYFITYFFPVVTIGAPKSGKLLIKDFEANKSGKGKRASFGNTIQSCDKNIKVGQCFTYDTLKEGRTETIKVKKIVSGFFKDIEQLFLEDIKERLEEASKEKGCLRKFTSDTMALASQAS